DHHDLIGIVDLHGANHRTVTIGHFDRDNPFSGTGLGRVLFCCGTFTVTVLRDGEDGSLAARHNQRYHAVAVHQTNTAHAGRGTTHGAHRAVFEANHFTLRREQHDFVIAGGQVNADQLIALVEVNRDNPRGTRTAELFERGFLHGTAGGSHKDVNALF